MKKTSTFLYPLQFHFPFLYHNNDRIEISNSLSSVNYSQIFQIHSSVFLNEYATTPSKSKMSHLLQDLPVMVTITTISDERATNKQPTFLQLLQAHCVPVFARGRCLHSAFMYYKSMSLFMNPSSSILNLI